MILVQCVARQKREMSEVQSKEVPSRSALAEKGPFAEAEAVDRCRPQNV